MDAYLVEALAKCAVVREGALTRLDEIAEEYKRRFSQESVLRVTDSACVAF